MIYEFKLMAWEDKTYYWAWHGSECASHNPPTEKRLEYATVQYPNVTMNICCGVFDDDKYTPLRRDEIAWHEANGAKVTF